MTTVTDATQTTVRDAATVARMKHRSNDVTQGAERAPARAMLLAMGLTQEDLDKPFVAIANLASDVTPLQRPPVPLCPGGQGGDPAGRRDAL